MEEWDYSIAAYNYLIENCDTTYFYKCLNLVKLSASYDEIEKTDTMMKIVGSKGDKISGKNF